MNAGLTPQDRDLIRAALGKVNKRIALNILQKIDSGGIPTPREMDILNSSAAADPPAAPPVAANELHLESPDTPLGQAGVAALYQCGVRTVKHWCNYGRKAGDPPPLHTPQEMPAWWQRIRSKGIVKQKCGDRFAAGIYAASSRPQPAGSDARPSSAVLGTPLPAPADITIPDLGNLDISFKDFDPSDVNFDHGVAMAKMNFKVQASLLVEAYKSGIHEKMRAARTAFEESLSLYRQVERDREKIMASSGQLLNRDAVRREMLNLHGNIASRFKARLRDAMTEMPTAIQSRETWVAFVDSLVDEICRGLAETRFAEPSIIKAA